MTSNNNRDIITAECENVDWQRELIEREGIVSAIPAQTASLVGIDNSYGERMLTGALTPDEHSIVYESMFPMKKTPDGDFVLNDIDAKFDYVAMMNYLIDHLDIKVFASREKPTMPKRVVTLVDGRYINAPATIPTVVNYLSKGVAKEGNVNSVIYAISNNMGLGAYFEDTQTNPRRANFSNGVVDISGDDVVFGPHLDDDVFFTRVPHDYPTDGGECPVFQEFLDYALDPKYHKFIYEWIGYCFFETYEFQNILFHHGVGGSGKSTLLKLIAAVLGPSNVSAVSLKQMSHEKFTMNGIEGSMANHGAEVSYKDMKDGVEILKQLSSGVDPVLIEQKYEKAYPIINTAKLSFAMNNLPQQYKNDTGLWRRLILVEWLRPMEPGVGVMFNSNERGMLTPDEINGVIYKSIQAFHAMVKRTGGFSYAPSPRDVEKDYAVKSDSIGTFVHERIEYSNTRAAGYQDRGGDWEATCDIFVAYERWCADKHVDGVTKPVFGSRHGLASVLKGSQAELESRKHDGKYNVRGWRDIILVLGIGGEQSEI